MKKSVLLFVGIIISALLIAAVGTSIEFFFMPGSQIGQSGNLESPGKCDNCHGGYDEAVEPAFNWQGGMMAQAMRDPIFLACLAIANQDAPGSGNLCIRCHAPDGWLNGRAIATDGSALNNNDREGVQCDFCHKLVKPSEIGINPYPGDPEYTANTFTSDQEYLATLSIIPPKSGNGMYIAHSANAKRGPFVDAEAKHQMNYSPFHSESALCGTCHDVSSPVFNRAGEIISPEGKTKADFDTYAMLPVERTFSEWKASDFNPENNPEGIYSAVFGGNKEYVSSCQDCHMRDVSGYGANKKNIPYRDDLPLHDMTGGNTFAPDIVAAEFPGEVNQLALNAGKERALYMLKNAATMELEVEQEEGASTYEAEVKIINNTGHKLPSGYPEGRRMWINMQAFDISGDTIWESGNYNYETAELTQEGTKIYEIKLGMTQEVADAAGLSKKAGESFHFVLNNYVVKDNRIPPRGFTNQNFIEIQSPVVTNSMVNEELYEDGDFYDETDYYGIPENTYKIKASLLYQTASKEYIEFLRDENTSNDAGQRLYDLWSTHGKSTPVVMCEQEIIVGELVNLPPVAAFTATLTSGEAPLYVSFSDNSTNAPTSWSWNFGDGANSSEQHPKHTYTNDGTYEVTLAATNAYGTDTETQIITVTGSSTPTPIAVSSILFTNYTRGKSTYISANVQIEPPIPGATVFAEFSGSTLSSVSGTTNGDGIVSFSSEKFKGSGTWCLTVNNILAEGYSFTELFEQCQDQTKSASLSSIKDFEQKIDTYPNPFTDKLNFRITHTEDASCMIELFDATGRKLDFTFKQEIKANEQYKVEYSPKNFNGDILFYRIILNDQIKTGKVVYQK